MIKYLLLLFMLLCNILVLADGVKGVAVLPFKVQGSITEEEKRIILNFIPECVETTIFNLDKNYVLKIRISLKDLPKERFFQNNMLSDADKNVFRDQGVDYIIVGTITKLDRYYYVTYKIFNVITGEIISIDKCKGKDLDEILEKFSQSFKNCEFSKKTLNQAEYILKNILQLTKSISDDNKILITNEIDTFVLYKLKLMNVLIRYYKSINCNMISAGSAFSNEKQALKDYIAKVFYDTLSLDTINDTLKGSSARLARLITVENMVENQEQKEKMFNSALTIENDIMDIVQYYLSKKIDNPTTAEEFLKIKFSIYDIIKYLKNIH